MDPVIYQNTQQNYKFRLLTMAIVILYIMEYHFVYENFIAKYFSYANINYSLLTSRSYFSLIIQAFLPFLFFKGAISISSLYSFFIYILVYIPIVNALYTCGIPTAISKPYGLVFFICMSLFFITDKLYLGKRHINRERRGISFGFFEIVSLVMLLFCILINRNNMTFVNFLSDSSDLYEMRAAYISSGKYRIAYYFVLWLAHFILPLLSVVYIANKSYLKLFIVMIASILVYMINMQKATFIIPILIVIVYYIYNRFEEALSSFIPILSILLLGGVSYLLYSNSGNPIVFRLAAIFIMRSQCIEGMEFDRYIHFFEMSNNPPTHYTHIGLINKLTGAYPYPESIGRMVAGDGGNSNATFWLMDGVAADGMLGVLLVSILFIIVKGYLNTIGLKYNYIVVVFSLLYVFSATANVSLFTVILSEGLLLALLTFCFVEIPIPRNESVD